MLSNCRYSSLVYRDLGRWEPPINKIEELSVQSYFSTLQHAVSRRDAFRGIRRTSSDTIRHPSGTVSKKVPKTTEKVQKGSKQSAKPVADILKFPVKLSVVARHKLKEITHAVKVLDSGHVARIAIRERIFDEEVASQLPIISVDDMMKSKKAAKLSERFSKAMADLSERQQKVIDEREASNLHLSTKMAHMELLADVAAGPAAYIPLTRNSFHGEAAEAFVDISMDHFDDAYPKIDQVSRYLF